MRVTRILSQFFSLALLLGLIISGSGKSAAEELIGSAETGKADYDAKCGACHSVDMNRMGPLHRGVVGRVPGSAAGYVYSPALKRLGGTWTAERLDLWLQDPQRVAPGAKMYVSVPDPQRRRDIIAYLQSVSVARPAIAAPTPR